jgi:ABC-type spermidine/putrescine transport system permease subunit I
MATVAQVAELAQAPSPRAHAVRRRHRVRLNAGFFAMTLLTLLVGFLVLFPLGMLLFGSFWTARPGFPGSLTLQNYIEAYTSLETLRILGTTVLLIGSKTLVAAAFATSLAWIVTRTDTPMRGTLEVLITLPFFIPGLLEAIAWIMLMSPNAGTINVWLRSLGVDGPFNIYSLGGMIWVMSLGSTSFIFLLVVNALRNMDASLEESARASGAGAVRTALTVTLPLMAPVIISAGVLSFIRAMDAFEVPVLLGLPAKVFVFSNRIYAAVQYDYPVNYGLATALGVSFVALMLALIYFQNRLKRGRDFSIVTGKGYRPCVIPLGRFRYVTLAFCLLFFFIATALPLSQVVLGSFLKVFGLPRADLFTFDNYLAILTDATLWRGLINTFIVCGGGGSDLRISVRHDCLRHHPNQLHWSPSAGGDQLAALGDSRHRRRTRDAVGLHHPAAPTVRHPGAVGDRAAHDGFAARRTGDVGRHDPARTRARRKLARAWRQLAVHVQARHGPAVEAGFRRGVLAVICQFFASGQHHHPVRWSRHGAVGREPVQLQPGGTLRARCRAGHRVDDDQCDRAGGCPSPGRVRRRSAFVIAGRRFSQYVENGVDGCCGCGSDGVQSTTGGYSNSNDGARADCDKCGHRRKPRCGYCEVL